MNSEGKDIDDVKNYTFCDICCSTHVYTQKARLIKSVYAVLT